MMQKDKKYRIFISAAEPSADDHCANLITALRSSGCDNIELVGIGGPKMAQAGCKLLEVTVGKAAMLYNAFTQIGHYYMLLRRVKRYLRSNKVDLAVVCDSPSFNWHVAKFAKSIGIKTLFYVAPQLWAWGGWRIRKMRKSCDKLCCLLPFEQKWFSRRGVDTIFVGNPMLGAISIEWGQPKDYSDFDPKRVRVAIMPGSRDAELKSLWRPMQQIALRIKAKYPGATFVTVAVDDKRRKSLEGTQIPAFECDYAISSVCKTADAADFAIVASGSATLEVAAMACPMVVMYQSSRLAWRLVGWWLIKTKYLCLVNILAGRELVPEFMPYFTSIDPIVEEVEQFLNDRSKLAQLSGELAELTRPLGEKNAGQETAKTILGMLD
ncbi:MAG: lipid-A-disaccharide synthase [Sedimentisphaerales bacterium]|nr:lipid-A-disaccharide synthase [Sedimentisphaerales bacterium]